MFETKNNKLLCAKGYLVALIFLGSAFIVGRSSTDEAIEPMMEMNLATTLSFFTENVGQLGNPDVRYYLDSNDMLVGFLESALLVRLVETPKLDASALAREEAGEEESSPIEPTTGSVLLHVSFEGSNLVLPMASGELAHRSNFFIGDDIGAWRTGVRNFHEIVYQDLYDGIDLLYHPESTGLKYEFVADPGADPNQIRIRFEGAEGVAIQSDGSAIIQTAIGSLHDDAPIAYQGNSQVHCEFVLKGALSYGMQCLSWDPQRPLVIDPVVYCTLIGGYSDDYPLGIAVDAGGNAYVTGYTASADFPTTPGFDPTYNYGRDAFVTKLNAAGSALVYSTFLGGSSWDYGWSIAVDYSGNAIVAGMTFSANFPVTPGAFDPYHAGGDWKVYLTKLNGDGSALVYSTYFGGSGRTKRPSVSVDANGNAYVGGEVEGSVPTTPGAFDRSANGYSDMFIAKFTPVGGLVYSTYLGGGGNELEPSVAADSTGYLAITGITMSAYFPITPGAFDTTHNGYWTQFVARLNPEGSGLVFSTFLGNTHDGRTDGIAADAIGNVYITGSTSDPTYPTTPGAYDLTHSQPWKGFDAFVTKLTPGGALAYSTFLGTAGGNELGNSIWVDSFGSAYVAGKGAGKDFPHTPNAPSGYFDAFMTKFSEDGSTLVYSTTFSHTNWLPWYQLGPTVTADDNGGAYLAGTVQGDSIPVTPGSFDTTFNGGNDAYVVKFATGTPNTAPEITSFTSSTASEGISTIFEAVASDIQNDPLTYCFDFQDDGSYDTCGSSNTASFTWGDDHTGVARVRVSDGRLSTEEAVEVHVINSEPTVIATVDDAVEGSPLEVFYQITDSGSDDLYATIDWKDGTTESASYLVGVSPDPPESTDLNPRDVQDMMMHVYADDTHRKGTITVIDDDGGTTVREFDIVVVNGEPTLTMPPQDDGEEGKAVSFSATATDPGADDLTFCWDWDDGSALECRTFYNPGGIFPFTVTDAPTHTWGDDGIFNTVFVVTDDDGGSESVMIMVEIKNVDPLLTLSSDLTVSEQGLPFCYEGSPTTVYADFADQGSDDIVLSWSWEFGPARTATFYNDDIGPDPDKSPGGTYPFTGRDTMTNTYGDDGFYSVTVEACDDDGGCETATFVLLVYNQPPVLEAVSDSMGSEGSTLVLVASFIDPGFDMPEAGTTESFVGFIDWGDSSYDDNDVTAHWTSGSPGLPSEGYIVGSHCYADNGFYEATLTVCDDDSGCSSTSATVTVLNVPPEASITGPSPGSLYAVGTPVAFAGTFVDAGRGDSHTATWSFSSNVNTETIEVSGTVEENLGCGYVGGTYTFEAAGVYLITLTIMDDDGGVGQAAVVGDLTAFIVVYDPVGGFITGGGWINSPPGAYSPDPALTGKATFGFTAKYVKGAAAPEGQTEFRFRVANLNFDSTLYDWLVCGGPKCQFKGRGTVNGIGNYGFLLSAIDGQLPGGGNQDKLRMKIWDIDTGDIIYDNQRGASDFSDPTMAIGGGNIVIHKG